MARQRQVDNSQRSVQEKCDYYGRRVNDPKLTKGQRKYAQKRLNELCGNNKRKNQPQKAAPRKSSVPATAQQNNAKMAGIGFGAARAGARVPVAPENQQSFRDGVQIGRALGNKF